MKYLLGSEKDFYNFVDSISKKDKIGIITHTDLDGLASAIFLQKILESRVLNIKCINFLDYSADAFKNLKLNIDVLFFTDWSIYNYEYELEKFRKKFKVFVIDHHPINPNLKNKSNLIKTDSGYCSAHNLFDLSKKYIDSKKLEWLVCSAIILDYCWDKLDNLKFIQKIYPSINRENIWNSEPGKIGKQIANALIYYSPDFKKVYDLVLKKDLNSLKKADEIIQKEIIKWKDKFRKKAEYYPEKSLYFYYGDPKYNIASVISSKVSDEIFPNETILFASGLGKNLVKISARNQTGKIDLGNVLKKCIEGFENSSAGGHIRASAARFPKKYLNEFKKRLLREL